MPETVKRGYVPTDEKEFVRQIEKLRSAGADLYYLINRGYPIKSASVFIGNHYLLSERQRMALVRSVSPEERIRDRKAKEKPRLEEGAAVFIDGFNTIIYLAAITNIDPNQYEAATIDGANRFQKMLYITLPNMRMIIVLMMVLSLGNVLNAGFDQVYNLYSKQVYSTGDILDTFIYRIGLLDAQFGVATAMGMFKSVVSTIFISVSYFCAYKFADYRIF